MESSQGQSSGFVAARESNKTQEAQPAARALQLSPLPKGDFYLVPPFFPLQSCLRQGGVCRKDEQVSWVGHSHLGAHCVGPQGRCF